MHCNEMQQFFRFFNDLDSLVSNLMLFEFLTFGFVLFESLFLINIVRAISENQIEIKNLN